MATDLTPDITTAAVSPSSAEADGVRVQARPLPDVIAADKYLKGAEAAKSPPFGLRLTQIIPGGSA